MDLRAAAVMPDIVLTPPASRKLPEPCPSSSMAEQWTFNPLVGGSSPPGGTQFEMAESFGSAGSQTKKLTEKPKNLTSSTQRTVESRLSTTRPMNWLAADVTRPW